MPRRGPTQKELSMDYRRLGASGFTVPVLSFGTGTFGGKGEFFKAWGGLDVEEAKRLVDVCLDAGLNMFDSADVYSAGEAEAVFGEAIKGRPRDSYIISTKAHLPQRQGRQRRRLLPLPPDRCGGEGAEAARDRLRRPFPTARLRRHDAGGGGAVHPRPARARGEDSLYGRLQLLRLALDEVAGGGRQARLSALCGQPDLLLPDRPRL